MYGILGGKWYNPPESKAYDKLRNILPDQRSCVIEHAQNKLKKHA